MDTLNFLQHRRSCKKFGDTAPTKEQLEQMFKAALRAPDHGKLKPYRFVVIENKQAYYQALLAAAEEFDQGERGIEKAEKLANQSPIVVAAIAKLDPENKKVPTWEQMVTTGCATYALQLAANVQGFETVWISKHWVQGSAMRSALNCTENEKIIGLVMIGSPQDKADITTAAETENTAGFVSYL